MVRAGGKEFRENCWLTHLRFEISENDAVPCSFSGFYVAKSKSGKFRFEINQHSYLKNIKPLPLDTYFSKFRSRRMKLVWLSHTKPDVMYKVFHVAKIMEAML